MSDEILRQEIRSLREALREANFQNAQLENLLARATSMIKIAHQCIEDIFEDPSLIESYKAKVKDHSNNLVQ